MLQIYFGNILYTYLISYCQFYFYIFHDTGP